MRAWGRFINERVRESLELAGCTTGSVFPCSSFVYGFLFRSTSSCGAIKKKMKLKFKLVRLLASTWAMCIYGFFLTFICFCKKGVFLDYIKAVFETLCGRCSYILLSHFWFLVMHNGVRGFKVYSSLLWLTLKCSWDLACILYSLNAVKCKIFNISLHFPQESVFIA